jgi:hypothetical protein
MHAQPEDVYHDSFRLLRNAIRKLHHSFIVVDAVQDSARLVHVFLLELTGCALLAYVSLSNGESPSWHAYMVIMTCPPMFRTQFAVAMRTLADGA